MANRVIVVGGGAAGLMAAGTAAGQGADVLLLEKMIFQAKDRISGKGRCNITNARTIREFIAHYPGNGKFLYSALHRYKFRFDQSAESVWA